MHIPIPSLAAGACLAAACLASPAPAQELRGRVRLDGSSTVFPISEAMAEEFQMQHRRVRVTVGLSGTGGGFKKFMIGETDINDASRPIKDKEQQACAEDGIGYVELPIAFDGLSVVVSHENDWVDHLTLEELKRIWEPESTVRNWSQVRAGWPDEPIRLYGPDHDSGTFDYFTEEVVGTARASRSDYTASADDNILVTGVAGDKFALGYFGYAYYQENRDKIRAVAVDGGSGPVLPSMETVANGSYRPLSRPLFLYVSTEAWKRPEIRAFVHFYLDHADELVSEVGYVPLPARIYGLVRARFDEKVTGSVFSRRRRGATVEELLTGKPAPAGKAVNPAGSR